VEAPGHLDRHLLRADRLDWHGRDHVDRQHAHQSPSPRRWRKRGAYYHAIGRSRGGRTTKIHALTDDLERPLSFLITVGNSHGWLLPINS
jgi:hypothetical protein